MSHLEKKVFISHSSADAKISDSLYRFLEQNGVGCWLDTHDLTPGIPYAKGIMQGLQACEAMVILISAKSIESSDVLNEIDQAHAAGKILFPVFIEEVELPYDFRYYLARRQWITAYDDRQKAFDDLLAALVNLGVDHSETGPGPSKSRGIQQKAFYTFVGIQTLVFGVILEAVVSMFFFGLLTMPEGQWAFRYNVALAICLGLTMYATWNLFQKKRIAYAFLCVLDILEFVFLCGLARRITVFALQSHHTFHTYPYALLDDLGRFIVTYGDVTTVLLLIFTLGALHIGTLSSVLFIKYPGRSMWSRMK